MTRKLIQINPTTVAITLPKKWVVARGLEAGNEVGVDDLGQSLVVSAKGKRKLETDFSVTKDNFDYIEVNLTHLYRIGYDTINVSFTDKRCMKEINRIVTELLLGYEITKKEHNKCRIESITEPTEEKFEILLKRIFYIVKEMMVLSLEDIDKNKFENLDSMKSFRQQCDRFVFFCRRSILKKRFQQETPELYWEILSFLLHICHAHYYLYKYCSEKKQRIDDAVIKLFGDSIDYYQLFFDAYTKKQLQNIHKIVNLRKTYQFGECYSLLEKTNKQDSTVVSFLREIFRLIQLGSSPICVLLLSQNNAQQSRAV